MQMLRLDPAAFCLQTAEVKLEAGSVSLSDITNT